MDRASGEFFRQCMAPAKLNLKEGAQVMLLKNIDTLGGLVNGSRGVVVRFIPKAAAVAALRMESEAVSVAHRWPGTMVPVVRFMNGQEVTVCPASFGREVDGIGEYRRIQLPLKLAWTITIHKSQGMTLDAVEVSLAGIFAPGQAYVALSRARSLRGLQVTGWDGGLMESDARVRGFYEALESFQASSGETWRNFCARRWGEQPGPWES